MTEPAQAFDTYRLLLSFFGDAESVSDVRARAKSALSVLAEPFASDAAYAQSLQASLDAALPCRPSPPWPDEGQLWQVALRVRLQPPGHGQFGRVNQFLEQALASDPLVIGFAGMLVKQPSNQGFDCLVVHGQARVQTLGFDAGCVADVLGNDPQSWYDVLSNSNVDQLFGLVIHPSLPAVLDALEDVRRGVRSRLISEALPLAKPQFPRGRF